VLSNKEDNLLDSDVVAFLVPYDLILVPTSDPPPKLTLVAHVCVATNVDKSLKILNVTPMVVAPTNLGSFTVMHTSLLQHTPNAHNSKPLGDFV